MKQKLLPVLCAVLAAALLLSVTALIFEKSETKAAEQYIDFLTAQVQTLEEQNQALQLQLSYQGIMWEPIGSESPAEEEPYCTLVIDTWTVEDHILSVNTFAQAVLPADVPFSARLELWHGSAVLESHALSLEPGEAAGIFEADAAAQFEIPALGADEELQLWLVVEPAGSHPLSAYGAGWHLENEQLVYIAG